MKRIAVNIRNRVFSESIMMILQQTGEFRPVRIPDQGPEPILIECLASKPDILLMDVTPKPRDNSIEMRLQVIRQLRCELPDCKAALLCDEIAFPETARDVMRAKQDGKVDAFFYASVTAEYLMAALEAI